MAVPTGDWLVLMQHEYLRRYVADRGCAIKFVSGSDGVLADVESRLGAICRERLWRSSNSTRRRPSCT